MRETPSHIEKALREYSAGLEVRWCQRTCRWWLVYDGQAEFALDHDDGTPMMNLCESELLAIVRRCDNARNGRQRLQGMRRRRQALLDRQRAAMDAGTAAAGRETHGLIRHLKYGPRAFVGPAMRSPQSRPSFSPLTQGGPVTRDGSYPCQGGSTPPSATTSNA